MTESLKFQRRRRVGAESIPRVLEEWFAGSRVPRPNQSHVPWLAMIYPHGDLLSERWQAWKSRHPKATPPAGYDWLDDPKSTRHPSPAIVERARKCAAGPSRF